MRVTEREKIRYHWFYEDLRYCPFGDSSRPFRMGMGTAHCPTPGESEAVKQRRPTRGLSGGPGVQTTPAFWTGGEKAFRFSGLRRSLPGNSVSLRVIRDAAIFFVLQNSGNDLDSLGTCVRWMGQHLESPAFGWTRYQQASDTLLLDRIETHVLYARVLASYADAVSLAGDTEKSAGVYNRALNILNESQTEWDKHPNFYQIRSDLSEEIDFSRAWCLHGKGNYRDALRSYTSSLDRYPSSDFTPAALWNTSQCLQVLDPRGSQQRLTLYFQRLEEEFPGSPETAMLRTLRSSR